MLWHWKPLGRVHRRRRTQLSQDTTERPATRPLPSCQGLPVALEKLSRKLLGLDSAVARLRVRPHGGHAVPWPCASQRRPCAVSQPLMQSVRRSLLAFLSGMCLLYLPVWTLQCPAAAEAPLVLRFPGDVRPARPSSVCRRSYALSHLPDPAGRASEAARARGEGLQRSRCGGAGCPRPVQCPGPFPLPSGLFSPESGSHACK